MPKILLWPINVLLFLYAAILSVLFTTTFFLIFALPIRLRCGGFDHVGRHLNGYYGEFMVRMFWPFVRVRRVGMDNIPKDESVMIITNHRSSFDVFFLGMGQLPNISVLVRSWPFKLPILGRFMRLAGYIEIEKWGYDTSLNRVRALAPQGVSFACFAEGHRSRDGKLQRFRSGAFRMATACNLRILPVCITGSEKLSPPGAWTIAPAKVTFKVFPPVDPSSFPEDKRALKLRRSVENIFREYLGE